MQLRKRWLAVVVVAGGVALAGCAEATSSDESGGEEPATIEDVKGSDVERVVLTKRAAERLGVEMAEVSREASAGVVPYASVVYDPNGDTWVYTSPKPLTFERTAITVDDIDGDRAVLSAGPPAGTEVVTVGTAELYGVEEEVGH